jgi:hypothetical protein
MAQTPANLVPNPEFQTDASGLGGSSGRRGRIWNPALPVVTGNEGSALRLTSVDFALFGKWIAKDIPVSAGRFYSFEVLYRPEGIVNRARVTEGVLSRAVARLPARLRVNDATANCELALAIRAQCVFLMALES